MYRTRWDYFWIWAASIVLACDITITVVEGSADWVLFVAAVLLSFVLGRDTVNFKQKRKRTETID